jgi:hypothetical protein
MRVQHRAVIVLDIDIDNYQDGATIEKITEYYKEFIKEHIRQETGAEVINSQGQLLPRRSKKTANISRLCFRGSRGKNKNLSWVQKERQLKDKININTGSLYK